MEDLPILGGVFSKVNLLLIFWMVLAGTAMVSMFIKTQSSGCL